MLSRMQFLLLLVACREPVDSGSPTIDSDLPLDDTATDDTAGDTALPCTAAVVSISPEDAAPRVPVDGVVTVTLSDGTGTPTITLSADGVPLSGVTTTEGVTATFTPDEPLAAYTTYTTDATVCETTPVSHTFTSNGVRLAADVTGYVYDLPFVGDDLTWNKPALLGSDAFATYMTISHMLFLVESTSGGEIRVVGATADNSLETGWVTDQYRCSAVLDFATGDFSEDPWFDVGPANASLRIGGAEVPAYDFHVSGYFQEGGGAIDQLNLTGLLDTRPLTDGFGFDVCAFAGAAGDDCEACPDGEILCLAMDIVQVATPRQEGGVVDPDVVPENETCEP